MSEFIRAQFIDDDLQCLVSKVYDHFNTSTSPLQYKLIDKRSLSANSQAWVWAKQLAAEIGDDINTVYCRMKINQGLPITLADPVNGPVMDYILQQTNFYSMPHDKQIKLVSALEVTRHFSPKQHREFRDSVQQWYNNNGFNLQYMEK